MPWGITTAHLFHKLDISKCSWTLPTDKLCSFMAWIKGTKLVSRKYNSSWEFYDYNGQFTVFDYQKSVSLDSVKNNLIHLRLNSQEKNALNISGSLK